MPIRPSVLILGIIIGVIGTHAYYFWSAVRGHSCENWGGLNTVSYHFHPAHKYNEENWGFFYECRNPVLSYQAGYYKNSFKRDTLYIVGISQPWRVGPFDVAGFRAGPLEIGGFLGPATGYTSGGVELIGGAMLTLHVTRDAAIQLVANPAVAGLQLKARF